jgi:hypothetical protein
LKTSPCCLKTFSLPFEGDFSLNNLCRRRNTLSRLDFSASTHPKVMGDDLSGFADDAAAILG